MKKTLENGRRNASFLYLDRETGAKLERHRVDEPVTLHFHEYCELEVVTAGAGEMVLNGDLYPLTPGTVYLLSPLDFHEVRPSRGLEILNFSFREDLLREDVRLAWTAKGTPLLFSREAGKLTELYLAEMERELARSDPWAARAREDLLELMVLHLTRLEAEPVRREGDRRLEAALRYLYAHFREPVTLGDLARFCGYSPPYLSRLFRKALGRTFVDLVTELRVRNAKMRLTVTDDSIVRIAEDSGFTSTAHFFRVFRAAVGLSPKAFRAAARGNTALSADTGSPAPGTRT